jgi:hypothetical protein
MSTASYWSSLDTRIAAHATPPKAQPEARLRALDQSELPFEEVHSHAISALPPNGPPRSVEVLYTPRDASIPHLSARASAVAMASKTT